MNTVSASSLKSALLGATALAILLEVVGRFGLAGSTWPPLSKVVVYIADGRHMAIVLRGLGHTVGTAVTAFLIGSALAVVIATITHFFGALREGVLGFSVFVNAFPPVSIAPVLVIVVGDRPAGVILASAFVFFLVYVSMMTGLARSKGTVGDTFTAFGTSRRDRFLRLDLPASLPSCANGLANAVPAALVGAILAEWFSGDRGIGLLLISAMRNYQMELLWAAMLATAVVSLALYGLARAGQAALMRRYALDD